MIEEKPLPSYEKYRKGYSYSKASTKKKFEEEPQLKEYDYQSKPM